METEIQIVFPDESTMEYNSLAIPRKDEYMDFDHKYGKGTYIVEKVTHKVFTDWSNERTLNYVKVHLNYF